MYEFPCNYLKKGTFFRPAVFAILSTPPAWTSGHLLKILFTSDEYSFLAL